jgi:Predicted membrane protein (DUF2306)
MPAKLSSVGRFAMWLMAFATAIFSARYFLIPPRWFTVPAAASLLKGPVGESLKNLAPYLYNNHRFVLLFHIACGIFALVLGLFQFVPSLRSSRSGMHRTMGMLYVSAVVLSGIAGFPLSFMMYAAHSPAIRPLFLPTLVGLASLSIAWPLTTLMALTRAKQRRFADHRAWMIRSYALTFSAPTARLLAPLLFLLTGDIVLAINVTFVSWPLNLLVAQFLIRHSALRSASASLPATPELQST